MKNKKNLIIISVMVVSAVLAVALSFVLYDNIAMLMFSHTNRWKYNAEFAEYEADFELVKDYVYENYNGKEAWVSVSYDSEIQSCRMYLPSQKEYADLPGDVSAALTNIKLKAFADKDANFDVIRIEQDRVAFCIENGQYALVYSNGQKPTGVNLSEDGEETFVKKINSEWYHVVRKSD